jgi:fructose-1,6-bisphosphatase/inositol monophosphatase family enzyme
MNMTSALPMPVSAPFTKAQQAMIRNLVRRAARAEILPRFRRLDAGDIKSKSDPTDLVTEADVNAEAIITRGLQMAFPSAVIVGEEAVAADPTLLDSFAEAELGFLIDPVDGTWNFAQGMPVFATMVAACRFGRPAYSLIYDPLGDDSMEADLSQPARHVFADGRLRGIETAAEKPVADMMGYAQWSLLEQAEKVRISAAAPQFRLVSTIRCSAHEYRMLARGAVDFVLGVRMTPWDHAAGVLLCQQAGGFAQMLDGREYTTAEQGYLLCASSKAVWDRVAEIVSEPENAPEPEA